MVEAYKVALAVAGIGGAIAIGFAALKLYNSLKDKVKITLFDPSVKIPLILFEVLDISPDTKKFRFKLPSPDHILGLPVGQHVAVSALINGERVVRYYTPITLDSVKGYVDFVIKIYSPNERFPNGGAMSQYLAKLRPGVSAVDFRGPLGKIVYLGNGTFQLKEDNINVTRRITVQKLSLVCGGTGITPMFQLIKKILTTPEDHTKIRLLYANNTENDILLRDELDEFQRKYSNKFDRWYTVTTPPNRWKYSEGFVTQSMLEEHIFPPGNDNFVMMCGPPIMIDRALKPNLTTLGYSPNNCFTF